MGDTPRTDAVASSIEAADQIIPVCHHDFANFARQLERELAAANARVVAAEARRDDWESAHQAMVERNAYLEAELARLSAPVTDAEVAEVLALDEKRTPGEWYSVTASGSPSIGDDVGVLGGPRYVHRDRTKYLHPDDAAFFAAAPRMVGIIRRLWAEREQDSP